MQKFVTPAVKFLITTALCASVCGCSLISLPAVMQKNTSKTHIIFSSWGSKSEVAVIEPILKEFEAQNPQYKVDFMHVPQNYFQKIHLLFASKMAPDLITINNQNIPLYSNAGLLEELNFDETPYFKAATDSLKYKGKNYALPRDVSTLVIYYNKDLFDAYKIPYPSNTWNFDDFFKTAQQFKKHGIWAINFEENPIYWLPFAYSNGCKTQTPDKVLKNCPGQIKFYADLKNKYLYTPEKKDLASLTNAQLFMQGKIAMMLSGRWFTPVFRSQKDFNFDVAPFPKGTSGSMVSADATGWAINKYSKNKDGAYKLLKHLSSKESIIKMTKSGLITPARKDVANSTVFLSGKPLNAKIFIKTAQNSFPAPMCDNYREISDETQHKLEPFFEGKEKF